MNIKTTILFGALAAFAGVMQGANVPDCGHGNTGTPDGCYNYALGGLGELGTSHTFAPVGATSPDITVSGFTIGRYGTLSTVNLYSKGSGGFPLPNDESGLGLVNDHSGDDEITQGSFIMLSMNGLSLSSLYMGSTTDGDEWEIWGSNTAAQAGQKVAIPSDNASGVLTGYSEGYQDLSSLAGDPYIFITSLRGNVLLGAVTACSAVPEPASADMLGMILIGASLFFRKRVFRKA